MHKALCKVMRCATLLSCCR